MLKTFWPSCPGSILVTTRKATIAHAARGGPETKLNIGPLSAEDGRTLFSRTMDWDNFKRLDGNEEVALETLLEHLGGLPLGICQIASLIHLRQSTINDFLHRYNREAGNIRKLSSIFSGPFDQDYNHGLETVWKMSFDLIQNSSEEKSFDLLGIISLLSPELIPADMFVGKDRTSQTGVFFEEESYVTNQHPQSYHHRLIFPVLTAVWMH